MISYSNTTEKPITFYRQEITRSELKIVKAYSMIDKSCLSVKLLSKKLVIKSKVKHINNA